jgi:hypothetical protein
MAKTHGSQTMLRLILALLFNMNIAEILLICRFDGI